MVSLAKNHEVLVKRLQTLATGFCVKIEGFTLPSLAFAVTDPGFIASQAEKFFLVFEKEGAAGKTATIRLSDLTPSSLAKSLGSSSVNSR